MNPKKPDRRQFLKKSAVLAGLAAGTAAARSAGAQQASPAASGHPLQDALAREAVNAYEGTPGPAPGQKFDAVYGVRSRFEISGRVGGIGAFHHGANGKFSRPFLGAMTPLQDVIGIITPNSLHYYDSHGYLPPDINPKEHRLLVHGMVDRPMTFTLDDLKRLPAVTRTHFIECNANGTTSSYGGNDPEATPQITHGLTSCSMWTGVLLLRILEMVGVQKGATWILAEAAEGTRFSKNIPMEKAMDDCLLAYGQNGEAVRPEQGYPLRLISPGYEGIYNVKWLSRLELLDVPAIAQREMYYNTRVEEGKYADHKSRWFRFEMGTNSVITRPAGGQRLERRGFYEITGLAWSGAGAIRRVEVSADNGRTWKDAELQGPVLPKSHTRFGFNWNWIGDETVLMSRSTDERGQVQPTLAELGAIWDVSADYLRMHFLGHVNAIRPWRVAADGSVYNAI
jgi:sulfane dehydrogenase subunit SoxC